MLVDWNNVDVSNLALFLDSETGRKLREMGLELMPTRPGKSIEESALASERMFGFLSFWKWAEKLTNVPTRSAKTISPWFIEEVAEAGKSQNPG